MLNANNFEQTEHGMLDGCGSYPDVICKDDLDCKKDMYKLKPEQIEKFKQVLDHSIPASTKDELPTPCKVDSASILLEVPTSIDIDKPTERPDDNPGKDESSSQDGLQSKTYPPKVEFYEVFSTMLRREPEKFVLKNHLANHLFSHETIRDYGNRLKDVSERQSKAIAKAKNNLEQAKTLTEKIQTGIQGSSDRQLVKEFSTQIASLCSKIKAAISDVERSEKHNSIIKHCSESIVEEIKEAGPRTTSWRNTINDLIKQEIPLLTAAITMDTSSKVFTIEEKKLLVHVFAEFRQFCIVVLFRYAKINRAYVFLCRECWTIIVMSHYMYRASKSQGILQLQNFIDLRRFFGGEFNDLIQQELDAEYQRFVDHVAKEPQYTEEPANQDLVPGLQLLEGSWGNTHDCLVFDELIVEQFLDARTRERMERAAKRLNDKDYEQSDTDTAYVMEIAREVRASIMKEPEQPAIQEIKENANLGKRSPLDEAESEDSEPKVSTETVNKHEDTELLAPVCESQGTARQTIEADQTDAGADAPTTQGLTSAQQGNKSTIIPEVVSQGDATQPRATHPVASQQASFKLEIPLIPDAPRSVRHQITGNPYKVLKLRFDDSSLDREIDVERLKEMVWEMSATTAAETNQAGSTTN